MLINYRYNKVGYEGLKMFRNDQMFWQNKRPSESEFAQMQKIFSEFDIPAFVSGKNPKDFIFVAKHHSKNGSGSILGGIVFRVKNFCAEIVAIGVRQDNQRKRIGTSLVRDMEKLLIERSVRRIEARVPNDSRRAFYRYLGFKEYEIDRMDRWIPRSKVFLAKMKSKLGRI